MRFDCGCGLVDLGMFSMLIGLGSRMQQLFHLLSGCAWAKALNAVQ